MHVWEAREATIWRRVLRLVWMGVFTLSLLRLPALVHAAEPEDSRSDAEWILSAQLADGALTHHADRAAVWPYLANYAAKGLADATHLTGDSRYAEAAWRWLFWYQDHQDSSGFVTDYRVENGALVSTGDMDSTDAYAGTFLMAAETTWRASGDSSRLQALRPGIAGAVRAIIATQDFDGLTWTKPSWRVKYLMDQAETYAGLRAAAAMAAAMGDRALAERAESSASQLKAGVASLWNTSTNSYDWAVHGSGVRIHTRWSVFSEALQQVWPVALGLVDSPAARSLMDQFELAQPQWDRPGATALYDDGPRPVGYVSLVGWAFARVGDLDRAAVSAGSVTSSSRNAGRAWPFTTGDAGQLVSLRRLTVGRSATSGE